LFVVLVRRVDAPVGICALPKLIPEGSAELGERLS